LLPNSNGPAVPGQSDAGGYRRPLGRAHTVIGGGPLWGAVAKRAQHHAKTDPPDSSSPTASRPSLVWADWEISNAHSGRNRGIAEIVQSVTLTPSSVQRARSTFGGRNLLRRRTNLSHKTDGMRSYSSKAAPREDIRAAGGRLALNVFVEKPVRATRLTRPCVRRSQTGRYWISDWNSSGRWDPAGYSGMEDVVDAGDIGEPICSRQQGRRSGPSDPSNWGLNKKWWIVRPTVANFMGHMTLHGYLLGGRLERISATSATLVIVDSTPLAMQTSYDRVALRGRGHGRSWKWNRLHEHRVLKSRQRIIRD